MLREAAGHGVGNRESSRWAASSDVRFMVGEAPTPLVSDLQIYKPKIQLATGYFISHQHSPHNTHGTYYRYVKVRKSLKQTF